MTSTPESSPLPLTVVMITLNEAHNMEAVCENLRGFARDIVVLDSFSKDDTVGIALRHGARVYQRKFTNFGDQWNTAILKLPISTPWVMKLDPDERLTPELKDALREAVMANRCDGIEITRQLWFMGQPLPVRHWLIRLWKHGKCRFSDVIVNEHPIVDGSVERVRGILVHQDSPDLDHWYEKQNHYSTGEAVAASRKLGFAFNPRPFGNAMERRMWLKKNFRRLPFRFQLLFLYNMIALGAWRAGRVGFIWCRLRSDWMRQIEYKLFEIRITGRLPVVRPSGSGQPDPRATQVPQSA